MQENDSRPELGLHVVWTTRLVGLPSEKGGCWAELRDFYRQFPCDYSQIEFSKPFHPKSQTTLITHDHSVVLTVEEVTQAANDIQELLNHDRVASVQSLRALRVDSTAVQLLLSPPPDNFFQVVGRLKSRSSGLLLNKSDREGQSHIWSRGFWFARVEGAENLEAIERFIHKGH